MLTAIVKWILCAQIVFLTAGAYETVEEAALIARRLVELSPTSIGTMATIFPADHPTLANQPFSLQEYYASCHQNGSLTLVFLPISRHSRNILASVGHQASISITSDVPDASRARVSLMGNVTIFEDVNSTPDLHSIKDCYLAKHPDAHKWLPGDDNAAHISYWARFDPQNIYFVGGFGDEHYIGEIPLDLYQEAASRPHLDEIQTVISVAGRVLLEA